MRVTAENLISNCSDLLELTKKLKKMLLISDYRQINSEVREQNLQRVDQIEQEIQTINGEVIHANQLKAALQH